MDRVLIEKEFSHLPPGYFNSAYWGPIPQTAYERGLKALARERNPSNMHYDEWRTMPDQVRSATAKLLDLNEELLAMSTSTSEIVSHVANGFPWKKGDVVVSYDGDYPSDVLPWMKLQKRYGFELQLLTDEFFLNPTANQHLLPKQTKLINVSHVRFNTGIRIPLDELSSVCKARGIFLMVDMTQSMCNCPVSTDEIESVDVAVFSTYKWMLGPYGMAIAAFSERALELLDHTHVGWLANPNTYRFQLLNYTTETLPGARRFDRGQAPTTLITHTYLGAVTLLSQIGYEKIGKHNLDSTEYFLENYPKKKYDWQGHPDFMSAIISLRAKTDKPSQELQEGLIKSGIDASVREGNLRLSFHIFNSRDQIDGLITSLDKII